MLRALKFGLVLMVLLLGASIPLAMQLESGSIEGMITNDVGPLDNASLEARNTMSGAIFETHSDSAGCYRLGNLKAGRYSLWVEAPGHNSTWIPRVIVERNQTTQTDIHLTISSTAVPGI